MNVSKVDDVGQTRKSRGTSTKRITKEQTLFWLLARCI